MHIDLDNKDFEYEILFKRVYNTTVEARRNGGHASHIKNLAYAKYNIIPEGLPTYHEQLTTVVQHLAKVTENLLSWDLFESEKRIIRDQKITLQYITSHEHLYTVITTLLQVTNRYFL